ncbi:phosphoribosylformylglycinamidine synthase subunit PurQ [Sporosarcina sp. CAU 1771]
MKFAVLVFPGSGCDVDMHHAVKEVLGEDVEYVQHSNAQLEQFDAVLIPTGASYGDYLRPGALAKSSPAIAELKKFVETGKPVLGVGNGFQILAETGILPGAFLPNKGLKFKSGKAKLNIANADSVFTNAYEGDTEITLPFAHQYGNYYVDEETAAELKGENRIAFTYVDNEDDSTANIAGVLNKQGNVLGMMPLPERAVEEIIGGTDGLSLFNSILKRWSEKNVNNA